MAVAAMGNVRDLEPLAKQLNPATDELNAALTAIQERLNALALGVEAWLIGHHSLSNDTIDQWTEYDGRRHDPLDERPRIYNTVTLRRLVRFQELGYGRLGDGWAFIIREMIYGEAREDGDWYNEGEPAEGERKPLLRSARGIRVQSVALIPHLIDKLRDEATAIIDAVEAAKRIAESLE